MLSLLVVSNPTSYYKKYIGDKMNYFTFFYSFFSKLLPGAWTRDRQIFGWSVNTQFTRLRKDRTATLLEANPWHLLGRIEEKYEKSVTIDAQPFFKLPSPNFHENPLVGFQELTCRGVGGQKREATKWIFATFNSKGDNINQVCFKTL